MFDSDSELAPAIRKVYLLCCYRISVPFCEGPYSRPVLKIAKLVKQCLELHFIQPCFVIDNAELT